MRVNVQTPNFVADAKLIEFVEKRLSKLELFYDRIISARVYLKVIKPREKENKSVEILLSMPGEDIMIKKEARTFEEGTDLAASSLERQLKKRKQKQRTYS
ncbi:ribosome hibernation-promoting factor, HPF/YfiA family [Aureitalea marina]|uniref:Ribosomal subunit interface protein n=1 Tax=Aureitalea marina TaxID=930804 RepID=A0A2S7KQC3_9FLAO|nr:ribosome-associated translation inhibitor RaiA [Aureitalea marina]PQB04824.1 ribosomal subunit interface protein [Aureitalea marina]